MSEEGPGRVRRGGLPSALGAARYDCFAVILYWINGAGNNRARHNARMGRHGAAVSVGRTSFSVRRMVPDAAYPSARAGYALDKREGSI